MSCEQVYTPNVAETLPESNLDSSNNNDELIKSKPLISLQNQQTSINELFSQLLQLRGLSIDLLDPIKVDDLPIPNSNSLVATLEQQIQSLKAKMTEERLQYRRNLMSKEQEMEKKVIEQVNSVTLKYKEIQSSLENEIHLLKQEIFLLKNSTSTVSINQSNYYDDVLSVPRTPKPPLFSSFVSSPSCIPSPPSFDFEDEELSGVFDQ
ncbi:hypothetical protein RCL1_007262 [Eukaryota sp. TZLM3-RCL]